MSALFVVAMGACGGTGGGCGACSATQPLPGGALPADQTVEGGAQIRVTSSGFGKLTSILPGVLNSAFANGFNIPGGTAIGFVDYCGGGGGSCHINVHLNGASTDVTDQQTLHVSIDASGDTSVPIDFALGSCTMNVSVDHLTADADLDLGIDPTTGELTLHLAQINRFAFDGQHFSGCSILSDIADVVVDILNSAVGQFVIQLLTPVLDGLVQNLLPHPLGVAGMMDVGKLLAGVSPGTEALMEARIVPGGYVSLNNSGMSLGVITGLNADEDPSTRTPDLDSEPALCVPPIPAPDFAAAPASLPKSTRNTFQLAAAGPFAGSLDGSLQGADIAMGISETTFDLAGHHLVTSGGLCLGVGTSYIAQLNVGTVGLLVQSLAELDASGKAPLLLVTRPQRAVDFTVGDGTAASPALTIGISHLEVDFYAFLYDRYVRAFTMDLSLNAGLNLDIEETNGKAVIKPVLTGISSSAVTITVENSQFVRETPAELEAVLPSVFDLVTPLLGNLPDIQVPTFAGFTLHNLSVHRVTTSQDDFLALYGSLGAGASFRALAKTDPFAAKAVAHMDSVIAAPPVPSIGTARLVSVHTPSPMHVTAALRGRAGGELPTVTFDTDRTDAQGRPLEWSWNLNGGLWRPYTPGGALVVSDRAFAWQGKYAIGLKSRVVGDYRTVHYADAVPVIIDSVEPTIAIDQAKVEGGELSVPIHDIVSDGHLEYAFGRPSSSDPNTAWTAGDAATLGEDRLRELTENGEFAIYARDEAGNVAQILFVAPFHGSAGTTGCACGATGAPSTGALLLIGLVGAVVVIPRRRRMSARTRRVVKGFGAWVGLSAILSLAPACSCQKAADEAACETVDDCPADGCPKGQLPFCIENMCVCSDDIPAGRIGPYSSVATAPDGTAWVAAYAESHGDLVVTSTQAGGRIEDTAWEWVDGIPDEPPAVMGSMIRGGIQGDGPDVGMYTSIAVAPDGTPMVTYFDVDHASLLFAAKVNGTWQKHVVDPGLGPIDGAGGSLVGMYTSITLRADDGRPGVAYLAHVADADGQHAEVRFAASQVPVPTQASDWQTWVVDTAPIPAEDPAHPDPYPLPGGLGLFVDVARDPRNQAPVVAYYDRANGDLKVARFDPSIGEFKAPVILAGTTDDAGWSPSVVVDAQGVVHVAYVDATKDNLEIVSDAQGATPQIIDDGYRIVGQTVDGLPKPTFDFVGDDAKLVQSGGAFYVSYQDATTQELLLAQQQADGTWSHQSVAGATDPWPGAYGFYASAALTSTEIVMSSWVIDQPTSENWVEVFRHKTVIE